MELKDSFVPHNVAMMYKAIGFNEPCFGWWMSEDNLKLDSVSTQPPHDDFCSAPTYEQLSDWLREYRDTFMSPMIRRNGPDLLYAFNVFSLRSMEITSVGDLISDYHEAYANALIDAL